MRIAEMPHDLYFLDEALLSFLLRVRCFFSESLDSALASVFDVFHQVNRSKVAFPNFFDGPVVLMKGYLIEARPQYLSPLLLIILDELELLLPFLYIKVHEAILDHESQLKFKG